MNILITGGLGYIGGRIADYLIRKNVHNITVTTHQKKYSIPDSLKNVNIQHVDILDRDRLIEICKDIDYIIHLAATNEIISAKNPHAALRVTTEGTLNMLEAAKEMGINKFMYFSTFHIYGPNKGEKITENQLPNPVHPYSITHYMAELYVNQFRQKHNFETIIIRLSNGYGAPLTIDVDRWTLVVNDLCYQAIKYGHLKLKSSGEQHRDFIPLSDVTNAVDLLMNTSYNKIGNGIFNLGVGYSISIKEICNRINKVYLENYGKELPIIISKDAPRQESIPVYYDVTKIKKLGFKPRDNYGLEILNTLKLCEKKVKEEQKNNN